MNQKTSMVLQLERGAIVSTTKRSKIDTCPKIDRISANFVSFSLPGFKVWFSYDTVVALETKKYGLVVRENDWSNTTGRHLNLIDGGDKAAKKDRLPSAEFEDYLDGLDVSYKEAG